ncbi:hypothetical protein GRF29_8g2631770 [Pseudopithomyces chartarum]|uniref:Rhodopsin domain-containing protein n=1 Tax=Pseudopithomyces chartarum TaxID=1892770 RepID=A0AAN6M779_9PLEO|nr:hypothetical protein GRF29_8g2631770 [Pseudopithomyces chartarum]
MGTLICLVVGGFCVLTWIARVIARLSMASAGQWGSDDWVMAAAMVIVIPLTFCAYILNQIGLGQDMWLVPFNNITKVLEIFYYTELLYLTAISLTKISILLFYLRIFPQRNLRRAIYVTIVFCALVTVVSVLRLGYVVEFAHTTNVTWDYMPVGVWSAVETHVGVMVACMPALRSLQTMISARFWPKAQQSSSYHEDGSGENSKKRYGKNSKAWASKSDRSRLSTLNRSKVDKQAFVELNDFGDQKTSPGHGSSTEGLSRSFSSNEYILPLAITPTPIGQRPMKILVQTEYSVNRETMKSESGNFRESV